MREGYRPEPFWHAELAILLAAVLQVLLPTTLSYGPKYLFVALEIMLLIGLRLTMPVEHHRVNHLKRLAALVLTALVSIANISSLVLVCYHLINPHSSSLSGKQLLVSAVSIYITNIIVFGLWYWQLDGGGHGGKGTHLDPLDFLFPQLVSSSRVTAEPGWRPSFFDYLFVSLTNGTAFSPTDTMPLTHRAKFLMSVQSLVSLSTIAIVAARAINILAS